MTVMELSGDGVDIVDAAAPDASAGMNESSPEAGVVGKLGMRCEVRSRSSFGKKLGGNFRAHRAIQSADEVDRAGKGFAVDGDLNLIAVSQFA
jgi:hypothetical protein